MTIFEILVVGGSAGKKIKKIVGGAQSGGSKYWGDNKLLEGFTKMHYFIEKVGNFSKIFTCGGLF